jgi:hypothetical protein
VIFRRTSKHPKEKPMLATPRQAGMVCLAVLWMGLSAGADDAIPFPEALDAAALTVDRLDSVLDYALLIGNGDVNALVYTDRGQLKLNLTKNDVWDARLDDKRDPPLPTLELVKKWAFDRGATKVQSGSVILDEGVQWQGPDSYHAHPYPCPCICARLVLGATPAQPNWIRIRAQGTTNAWEYRDGLGVMGIEGKAEASNGFSYGPVRINTGDYPELHVELSGTENARFYVDLMDRYRERPVLRRPDGYRRPRLLRHRLAGNADRIDRANLRTAQGRARRPGDPLHVDRRRQAGGEPL